MGNSKIIPRWCRRAASDLLIVASAALLAANANAWSEIPIVSGQPGWEASLDGITWVPAYGSYPNGVTRPDPDTTTGTLMWYWGEPPYTGTPTGKNGPDTAFFRNSFFLPELIAGPPAGAWVAADDWMQLTVNGSVVGTYTLADHLVNGQPDTVFFEFTDLLNTLDQGDLTGRNVFTIEAHDEGVYEYVFFDAFFVAPTDKPTLAAPTIDVFNISGVARECEGAGPGAICADRPLFGRLEYIDPRPSEDDLITLSDITSLVLNIGDLNFVEPGSDFQPGPFEPIFDTLTIPCEAADPDCPPPPGFEPFLRIRERGLKVDVTLVAFSSFEFGPPFTRWEIVGGDFEWDTGHGEVMVGPIAFTFVSEPATLTLLGLAFAGLGFARRRKLH